MLEVSAFLGVAACGALWRMAFAQGSMKRGMESILREIQLLRNEVTKDIRSLEQVQHDHEARLRILEKGDTSQSRRK
ncbi:MAG: hypothetical protein CL981_00405 [Euryarchaeota archaeon]|nr:hypothetical protein [Euryarchaeota archaeon]